MHLHLIEPRADGHRMQYVRRLIAQAPAGTSITLSTFPSALAHPGTKAALAAATTLVDVRMIDGEVEFQSSVQGGTGLRLQPAYWRLLRRHWRGLTTMQRGDLAVVPYLDYCSYAIGLLGSPFGNTPYSGIVMRPDFHWKEQGVVAPRTDQAGIKRWLFLRLLSQSRLRRLVTIDPSLVDWVRKHCPPGFDRLRLATDPADMRGTADRDQARRYFGLPLHAWVLLLFGSIDMRKGLTDLLAVAGDAAFPAQGVVLIVGRQSAECRALIAERGSKLPPGRLVCADRYVDSDEEWMAFAAADCGWLAYENFFGSSGVLAQCEQVGIDVVHRGEGLIGYRMAGTARQTRPWLPSGLYYGNTQVMNAPFSASLAAVYA
jgi:hypothetical protein